MHEVDMTKALLVRLKEWWLTSGQPQIREVHLHVGAFTCVEPLSLQHAFDAAIPQSFLQGCTLQIQSIPFVAHCPQCDQTYHPHIGAHYACPQCHHPLSDIVSGRELKIAHIVTEAYAPSY